MKIQVIHGPNLNLLGTREPELYGALTLDELNQRIQKHGGEMGVELRFAQVNSEGDFVDLVQAAPQWADALVVNPAGYTHTSVAIRDSLSAISLPAVAVHLTNPAGREWFRQTDIGGGACVGVISGFGWRSYTAALDLLASRNGDAP